MIINTELFDTFAPILREALPPGEQDSRFLMDVSGALNVFYAPFEYINPHARIVLVGITPGPTQMKNANKTGRDALLAGKSHADAIKAAKDIAAFSGEPLRSNLTKQLDHWGVHRWLGLRDCAELFSTSGHLVQTTSLLRYPVFKNGKPYSGTPQMTNNPMLRKYLLEYFAAEVLTLKDALFVSLGPTVQKVLDRLIQDSILRSEQVIGGMLHPSQNNTYRINYLIGDRHSSVSYRTNPLPYDRGRAAFRERFRIV